MGFLKKHKQICTTKETINVTQLIHRYLALPKWFKMLVLINKSGSSTMKTSTIFVSYQDKKN